MTHFTKAEQAEMTMLIRQQIALKQQLIDFALDAEDEIAIALETFSAQQLSRWSKPTLSGLNRSELAVEMFVTEGAVAEQSVLDAYVQAQQNLSDAERGWLARWADSFHGLFVVDQANERYGLTNWITKKNYSVWSNNEQATEILTRLKPGEMMIARLLPIAEGDWTFSGPMTLLGKPGKPKLAVAIGNFRQWFPDHLYSDAPDLEAAAWESVQKSYDDFVTFFGAAQLTLSGYELNKKLQAYQEQATEKQLAEAGLDSSKSFKELAADAGLSEAEYSEAMAAVGEENKVAQKLMESTQSLKMVTPKLNLPDELRRAESVTVFVYPRWGQTFLTDYEQLEDLLKTGEDEVAIDRLVQKLLENEKAIAPIWQQLAQTYPETLTGSLSRVSKNPSFNLEQDLDTLLLKYGKAIEPTIPDSASVPVHLHDLFQEALQAVGKSGKKKATKKKKKAGFGA